MPDVELSAGTVHYRDTGQGSPILFVHGILVNGTFWRNIIHVLEPQFRCIAPDLPLGGHRRPMRADADLTPRGVARLIAEFLDTLEVDNVTVVANDTGGAIAQLLLADGCPNVSRLVLTPSDSFDNFPPPSLRILKYAPRIPGLLWLGALLMRSSVVRRATFAPMSRRPIPVEVAEGWLQSFIGDRRIRADIGKFLRAMDYHETLNAAEALRNFAKPVLILWPPKLPFFPFEHARRWAELLPDATLVEVPDSFTYLPEDQPEITARAIQDFVHEHASS
ncbi:hypothetical protein MOTT12_00945 [Mycobacterium intracellulare subsp. yongonense]|uniref:alpha/beta fold hydrolase n=1 Tax=Mycobacterium TaxID=1763 RepID=UPI0003FE9B86|nr:MULTISPECIES: alpha/beta hydrolase [Mycobacterium]ARR76609.1 hypothetical protein MOTT12_00945 [Mycobacterium intracellulare subsp. yongonense]ARR81751.1 putative oxidoreductase [Mycobacterium intracellulare subsp. yongonense]KEF97378.1 hypothetical protein K883_02782 [Mycobacterium sp. TKK-01-0059]OCB14824.1 alpha/beta hydrolase [Mycobacterium intracellulare subsp. yongonense]